jgi:hypothetical protein
VNKNTEKIEDKKESSTITPNNDNNLFSKPLNVNVTKLPTSNEEKKEEINLTTVTPNLNKDNKQIIEGNFILI